MFPEKLDLYNSFQRFCVELLKRGTDSFHLLVLMELNTLQRRLSRNVSLSDKNCHRLLLNITRACLRLLCDRIPCIYNQQIEKNMFHICASPWQALFVYHSQLASELHDCKFYRILRRKKKSIPLRSFLSDLTRAHHRCCSRLFSR